MTARRVVHAPDDLRTIGTMMMTAAMTDVTMADGIAAETATTRRMKRNLRSSTSRSRQGFYLRDYEWASEKKKRRPILLLAPAVICQCHLLNFPRPE